MPVHVALLAELCLPEICQGPIRDCGRMTGHSEVIHCLIMSTKTLQPGVARRCSFAKLAAISFALFAPAALLAGGGTLAARGWSGALRRGLRRGRLPFGRVFRLDFCGRMLLVSGVAHRRSGVCFVGALGVLLFLLFFLRLFLDAAELS